MVLVNLNNIRRINNFYGGWLGLSRLGRSKLIKSFYIWFIMIPILANFIRFIDSEVNLTTYGSQLNIKITLPFSWSIFFLCSVFFTLGNILYFIRCPEIISYYNSFFDFKEKENSYSLLKSLFLKTAILAPSKNSDVNSNLFIKNIVQKYCFFPNSADVPKYKDHSDLLKISQAKNEQLTEIFALMRDFLSTKRPLSQFACFIFYSIGIVLLSYNALENIKSVFLIVFS